MKTSVEKVICIFFLLIIAGCNGYTAKGQGRIPDIFENTSWISSAKQEVIADSLLYRDNPAPLFRKEFFVKNKKIEKATLYITAAGYYNATLNGRRIGDIYLDPAWTNYNKKIYYSEYDLTGLLRHGVNCIGITLGNGFYNPLPLKMWGYLNLREILPVGNPKFIAVVSVKYADGELKNVATDDTWKFTYGPVIRNNVYLGEMYDARKEIKGWGNPGFDDRVWSNAIITRPLGTNLQKRFFPPIRIREVKETVGISSPSGGVYVIDQGENFTGIYKIRLRGNIGDTITLRFGERVYPDGNLNPMTTVCGQIKTKGLGGAGAPDIAWQEDKYIFGEEDNIWYSPEFTFHTFRYVEIKGLKYQPHLSDFQGLALNTDVKKYNYFECSSELLNSIQRMAVRTFLSNLISVQSDCPGREKFGYGGDINSVSESFICNFDMHSFYRKTIYDWVDAISDSTFIDTAPFVGLKYCGISWESAFLFLQYQLYLYYNDTEILKELYEFDLKWMYKVKKLHPDFIIDKGLGDHESLIPVPVRLTGTCHYLQAARAMKGYIESQYRIKAKKRYRAVAGLSMGGGGTFIYALYHPELFSSACPLSAAVGPVDAEKIKKMPPMWGVSSVRWYFDCGDEDFGSKGNALMHIALCDKKIPHEYRVRDGAHNWTYWRTALPEVLKFITVSFHLN